MIEKRLIGEIVCVSDSGKTYIIEEYQEFIDGTIPHFKHLKTRAGEDVNFIDSDTFRIVNTNEIIKRVR